MMYLISFTYIPNSSRYYFILFEVDAPIKYRLQRFREKYQKQSDQSLEAFVDLDDMVCISVILRNVQINFNKKEYSLYKNDFKHYNLIKQRFTNSEDRDEFFSELDSFNFADKDLIRPCWDTYFMKLAELAA